MADFMTPPADALMAPSGPVWLSNDGIVITIGTSQVQTIEEAKENLAVTKQVANGMPRPLLVDISKVRAMNKEAREEYVKQQQDQFIAAVALVTNSNIGKMIGNIFIGINESTIPTKLFTDPDKAKDWLLQYKVKQE